MSTTSHSTQPYSSMDDPEGQVHHVSKNSTENTEEATTLSLKTFAFVCFILLGLAIGIGVANQFRLQDNADNNNNPTYVYPPGCPSNSITDNSTLCVQVLFSNHVDIGFSAHYDNDYSAAQAVDHYFRSIFPQAINISAQLRAKNQGVPVENQKWYIYMTQWWLVSLYMDCPPYMGFYCPSNDEKNAFQTAINQGDITWHAFPFNLEAELLEPSLMDYMLQMSTDLASQFKRVGGAPNYVSQRDVPGTTRAIIPWLFKHGIKAITIGANQGSAPIGEGNAYIWKDPTSNTSIYTLYHKGGYGGIDIEDAVIIDGFNRVAIFDWNSDNSGPYSVDEINSHFDYIASVFKSDSRFKDRQITVVSTSLDEYINALDAAVTNNNVKLPIKTFEMGDTWIHGTGTDPVKVAKFRALQRLWSSCTLDSQCDHVSAEFGNFTRLLLKGVEHTWGGDVKSELNYTDSASWNNWSNGNLTMALKNNPKYTDLMSTWIEQRNWAIDIPLSALPENHPIRIGAEIEFNALSPKPYNVSGFTRVTDFNKQFIVGKYQIGFNNITGAINMLVNTFDSKVYATSENELASLIYSTFTETDFTSFLDQYSFDLSSNAWWVPYDFGKVGLDEHASTRHFVGSPILLEMYYRPAIIMNGTSSSAASFLLLLSYEDGSLHSNFGAPELHVVQIDLDGLDNVSCNITVTNYNKQYTRIPEALWVRFNPFKPTTDLSWTVNKIGMTIDPSNIAINGSQHLHATSSQGASLLDVVQISSPDIFLVALGDPNPFPTPLGNASTTNTEGINFSMFNNIWGTNYVQWYPFLETEVDQQYRFSLMFM